MPRILNPSLMAGLAALGASEANGAMLLGWLENEVASAEGRVNGLQSSIEDLARQKADAENTAAVLRELRDKLTVDA